ncbi:MAG: cell division protein FtsQ/DivIB [Xenococcaceae cyanobacterium]
MTRLSSDKIKEQKLIERTKKIQFWQAIWRSLAISCLSIYLVWLVTLPTWAIADRSQIQIQGNRLLSVETIYSLLPLSYPRSLWQISTQKLSQSLESFPPISNAKITRQLLPPSLIITIGERIPVAFAIESGRVGYLDENGIWIPSKFYQNFQTSDEFPTLKVVGFNREERERWSELYHLIVNQSVKVFEVNWQDPINLILKTELGTVRLGSSLSELSKKFAVLDRLRELPNHFHTEEIVYIDLTNPQSPLIQRVKKTKAIEPTIKPTPQTTGETMNRE